MRTDARGRPIDFDLKVKHKIKDKSLNSFNEIKYKSIMEKGICNICKKGKYLLWENQLNGYKICQDCKISL